MSRPVYFAFAFSALVCASTTSFAQDPNKLFNVPFFIENLLPPAPNALRANFTLQHPAILESISFLCAGGPKGALLQVDGGPLGVNGTTGVGSNPEVGLVVGAPALVQIDFVVDANGNSVYPPTLLGLPVKSSYSIVLFPNAPNELQCFGNAVFQGLN